MSQLTFQTINTTVLDTLTRPRKAYWCMIALLFCGAVMGASCWAYQIIVGVGVAGMNTPVHWGTYLINFVFWVGIAHSGTLISAILFLFRAQWRNPIARAAETMTVLPCALRGFFLLFTLAVPGWCFICCLFPTKELYGPTFNRP